MTGVSLDTLRGLLRGVGDASRTGGPWWVTPTPERTYAKVAITSAAMTTAATPAARGMRLSGDALRAANASLISRWRVAARSPSDACSLSKARRRSSRSLFIRDPPRGDRGAGGGRRDRYGPWPRRARFP